MLFMKQLSPSIKAIESVADAAMLVGLASCNEVDSGRCQLESNSFAGVFPKRILQIVGKEDKEDVVEPC
jgi:hypothetical protein